MGYYTMKLIRFDELKESNRLLPHGLITKYLPTITCVLIIPSLIATRKYDIDIEFELADPLWFQWYDLNGEIITNSFFDKNKENIVIIHHICKHNYHESHKI